MAFFFNPLYPRNEAHNLSCDIFYYLLLKSNFRVSFFIWSNQSLSNQNVNWTFPLGIEKKGGRNIVSTYHEISSCVSHYFIVFSIWTDFTNHMLKEKANTSFHFLFLSFWQYLRLVLFLPLLDFSNFVFIFKILTTFEAGTISSFIRFQ